MGPSITARSNAAGRRRGPTCSASAARIIARPFSRTNSSLTGKPARRAASAGSAGLALDLALALLVAAVALARRLPALLDVPLITNETEEIALALATARGETLPLVNVSDFLGAWNTYLTAAAFRLVGF